MLQLWPLTQVNKELLNLGYIGQKFTGSVQLLLQF